MQLSSILNSHKKTLNKISYLLLACSFANMASAQKLEEIIVTAQKRAESLQDVSVSVTALSGEKLADTGIARLEEVTAFVPNFTLSETGIGTNIYIRGIGSGINQGFEQSVGMYFDGVYYGRAQLARSPIFDLERVEVLRGPQVTLFGNNSIGGAVSIGSAKPTDDFEGSVGFLYEPDHGEEELTAVFSGPITPQLGARLAIRKYGIDGYIDNKFLNREEPTRDYLTTRLTLDFTPDSDAFNTVVKFERSDFDVEGRQIAIVRDEATNYLGTSTNAFVRNENLQQTGDIIRTEIGSDGFPTGNFFIVPIPAPNLSEIFSSAINDQNGELIFQSINGQTVAYPNQKTVRGANNDFSNNEINNMTVTTDIPLGNGDLKSITAYLEYSYEDLCDCDFTAAQLIEYESNEEYDQISQEFRYTSAGGEFIDYIVGGYYQDDSLVFNDFVKALEGTALEETLAFMFPNFDATQLVGIAVPRDFKVDSELFALFGQMTINISDSTRLMLGLRESRTKKTGSRELSYTQLDLETPLPGDFNSGQYQIVDNAFNIALNVNPHRSSGKRKEKRTSWTIILEQDLSEDYMMYASAVRGYKGGGFDARSNNPDTVLDLTDSSGSLYNRTANPGVPINFSTGTFEFEDEEALAFEVGLKASIGGQAEINISYFYTDIENLQLSVFDGGVGFNVSNAGAAVTQGVEMDWRVAITDEWMLNGSLAWLQFEYKDYKDGLCTASDILNLIDPLKTPENCETFSVPVPGAPTQTTFQNFADLTGETNQYVASYSGSVSVQYEKPVWNDDFLFRGSVDVNFTADYNPTQNLDEELQQGEHEVYNMRLSISDIDNVWELALLGRNLTDRKIVTYANDVPLATGIFGTRTSYGFIQRTRSVALQGRYNF